MRFKKVGMVARGGIEPPTRGFSVRGPIAVGQPLPIFLLHETRLARRCRDFGYRLHFDARSELVRETDSRGPDSRPRIYQSTGRLRARRRDPRQEFDSTVMYGASPR